MPSASLLCSNLYLLLSVGKCHKLDVLNTQKSAHLFGHAKVYSPISFNLTNLMAYTYIWHVNVTGKSCVPHAHKPSLQSPKGFVLCRTLMTFERQKCCPLWCQMPIWLYMCMRSTVQNLYILRLMNWSCGHRSSSICLWRKSQMLPLSQTLCVCAAPSMHALLDISSRAYFDNLIMILSELQHVSTSVLSCNLQLFSSLLS